MAICKKCVHDTVCLIQERMRVQTVMDFPDGSKALFDMEGALVECQKYVPSQAARRREEDLESYRHYAVDDYVEDLQNKDAGYPDPDSETASLPADVAGILRGGSFNHFNQPVPQTDAFQPVPAATPQSAEPENYQAEIVAGSATAGLGKRRLRLNLSNI